MIRHEVALATWRGQVQLPGCVALVVGAALLIACEKGPDTTPVATSNHSQTSTASPISSTAAAAPTASATTSADTAPPVDEPKTALQRLAAKAMPVGKFEKKVGESAWAVYPKGATGCPVLGSKTRLDKPEDAKLEFDRDKYRKTLVGQLVSFEANDISVQPSDKRDSMLSLYKHAAGTFKVTIKHQENKSWPALGGKPKIIVDKEFSGISDVFVADRGGYVVTRPRYVAFYLVDDKAKFTIKIDKDTARKWTENGVAIRYLIVQKFLKLGFHKKCVRVCERTGADRMKCPDDPKNQGIGLYYVTKPVGHELYVNDVLVSEKQPPEPAPTVEAAASATAASAEPTAAPKAEATAPPSKPRRPVPRKKPRIDRAACLRGCVASCNDDAHCERACVASKCR